MYKLPSNEFYGVILLFEVKKKIAKTILKLPQPEVDCL